MGQWHWQTTKTVYIHTDVFTSTPSIRIWWNPGPFQRILVPLHWNLAEWMHWGLYTGIFHMDPNPIPWSPYRLFFGWQPIHFIPYPLWKLHGVVNSMVIPCTVPCEFHGISKEFTLQTIVPFHRVFHMDSMEQSTYNSMEKQIKYVVKKMSTMRIKHWAPWHIMCISRGTFYQLSNAAIKRQATT